MLRLYDGPVYRDWAFWLTIGLAVMSPISIVTGEDARRSGPLWAEAIFATIVMPALFGVLPAAIRLKVRRWRWSTRPTEDRREDVQHVKHALVENRREPDIRNAAPPATAASPLRPGLANVDLANATILRQARANMPYPVARAARALQLAGDPKEQYESVLRTAEILSVVLGITAVAWARSVDQMTEQMTQLNEAMLGRGVAQGHWLDAAQSAQRLAARSDSAPVGMAKALALGKGGSGLKAVLGAILSERNKWAHGAGPTSREEAAERVGELFPALDQALDRASFLTESPWIVVERSAFRREGDFKVRAARAMGDHPDFEMVDLYTRMPLVDETFYLLTVTGAVDLHPLVVRRYCPTCRQPEMCYADRVVDDGVILKSFDRGHVIIEPKLVDEVRGMTVPGRQRDTPQDD